MSSSEVVPYALITVIAVLVLERVLTNIMAIVVSG
jgi:hypothetical protein